MRWPQGYQRKKLSSYTTDDETDQHLRAMAPERKRSALIRRLINDAYKKFEQGQEPQDAQA